MTGGGQVGVGGLVLIVLLFVVLPILLLRPSDRHATGGTVGLVGPKRRLAWIWPQSASAEPGPGYLPPAGWQQPAQPALPPVHPADVTSLRDRLGHDVRSLDPGTDPVARQALADAAERYALSGDLLERSTSDAMLRTAWLAAVEGLAASRVARERLGLDPGPPVPDLVPAAAPLTERTEVQVGGQTHVGVPRYEPGRPHWFPGGTHDGRPVPSGWYSTPFWPRAAVLGALGGFAAGGLLAGQMFGDDGGFGDSGGFGGGGGWGGDGSGGGWGDGGWGRGGGSGGDGGGGWGDGGGFGGGSGGGGGGDWSSGGDW